MVRSSVQSLKVRRHINQWWLRNLCQAFRNHQCLIILFVTLLWLTFPDFLKQCGISLTLAHSEALPRVSWHMRSLTSYSLEQPVGPSALGRKRVENFKLSNGKSCFSSRKRHQSQVMLIALSLLSYFETGPHYIVQSSLELKIFLTIQSAGIEV